MGNNKHGCEHIHVIEKPTEVIIRLPMVRDKTPICSILELIIICHCFLRGILTKIIMLYLGHSVLDLTIISCFKKIIFTVKNIFTGVGENMPPKIVLLKQRNSILSMKLLTTTTLLDYLVALLKADPLSHQHLLILLE